jgi:tight adherence protein C
MGHIFVFVSLGCLLLSLFSSFFLFFVVQQEKLARRLDRATGILARFSDATPSEAWHIRVVAAIGFSIARSGLLNAKTLQQLRHTLRISGIRNAKMLGLFVGTKVLFFLGFPIFVFALTGPFISSKLILFSCVGGSSTIGLLLPDFVITQRRKRFIKQLEAGLADTLDMMVICADAGLSLEAGLARVAQEIRGTHDAVAEELTITTQEMRIGADVRDALVGLGTRTGLASLKRLGSTLIQTIQYGTPLTQALRVLSAELRQEQLTRFEERAARLPVLLTIPMILFILPCVFLVVGGPAMLKVMQALAHS